ncbi:MAG: hypothetical protein HFG00_02580 [Oscillibacter sp.]|nr:hypothetical protein [Oscillibacter sp.]
METVSGISNWKLTIRREETGVTILQAVTCDSRAALPDRLFGLPVTALGSRALAPDRPEPPGETLLVTCGAGNGAVWDNRQLTDLTLPAELRALDDYALLNCSTLKTLRIYDTPLRWGGGVLMNCRQLDTLHLIRTGGEAGESLAYFAGELSRELEVILEGPGERRVRLLFPEYVELYEENCPAHHFDYFISGAGYPYHHCFRQKRLHLPDYDALWQDFLATEHDESAALRLAWYRLRCPEELSPEAAASYRLYLQDHLEDAFRLLLEERDGTGLRLLLDWIPPDQKTLSAACGQARELGNTAALAVLLEEQHKRGLVDTANRFAL